MKILESSQLLLNVVKVKTQDLATGKSKQKENKDEKKMVTVSSSTENIYTQQLPQ